MNFRLFWLHFHFPPQINKDISKEKVPPHLFFFVLKFTAFNTSNLRISRCFKLSFQIFKNIDEEITKYSQFHPFLVKFILYIKSMKKK
ncbi:hypothetical protein HMPREF0497_0792 [Lentilactobacillus buchneri ATCC 11577]|nr:hypothetical protein HMPREF0497_0792 [Lentilactobacillus buchneri ATCC 11577]